MRTPQGGLRHLHRVPKPKLQNWHPSCTNLTIPKYARRLGYKGWHCYPIHMCIQVAPSTKLESAGKRQYLIPISGKYFVSNILRVAPSTLTELNYYASRLDLRHLWGRFLLHWAGLEAPDLFLLFDVLFSSILTGGWLKSRQVNGTCATYVQDYWIWDRWRKVRNCAWDFHLRV